MRQDKRDSRVFMPTSLDIRQACDKIQERWSERERRKRAGWVEGQHWLPPLVEVDSLPYDVSRATDPQPY
ncbi:MAG: hypothetical protein ACYC3X_06505 [Pirellulaceae bacterium]